jgi:hypothetical protein
VRSFLPGLPRLGFNGGRPAPAVGALLGALMLVSGCGGSDRLDDQQADVQARQCVSLLERRVRLDDRTGKLRLKVGDAEFDFRTDAPVFDQVFLDADASGSVGPDQISGLNRVRASALSDLCDKLVKDRFGSRSVGPTSSDTPDE